MEALLNKVRAEQAEEHANHEHEFFSDDDDLSVEEGSQQRAAGTGGGQLITDRRET